MPIRSSQIRIYLAPNSVLVVPKDWTRKRTAEHFESRPDDLRLATLLDHVPRGEKTVAVHVLLTQREQITELSVEDLPIVITA